MALSVREHTAALIDRLEASTITTGNHVAPDDDPPYSVVYLISGGEVDGPTSDPDADAHLVWQVTSVGAGPEQAQWEADRVRVALIGFRMTVAGRSVDALRLQTASGGVLRDDDVTPPLFYALDRFIAWSYPA